MIRGIAGLVEHPEERAQHSGKIMRRLVLELRPHTRSLVFTLALVVAAALSQALVPWLIGKAIDGPIMHRDAKGLLWLMLVTLAVSVAGGLAGRAQMLRIGSTGQRILANLRERLFEKLQGLPVAFFDKQAKGDLMSRVSNDVDTLNQLISQGLTQVLGALLSLVGVLVAMLALNLHLALACMAVIPVMLLTTYLLARRARKAYRTTRETTGAVMADLQEEIEGVRESQAFNRTEANIARFRARNAKNRDANISATAVSSAFSPVIELLAALTTAVVIGYGSYLALHGTISVGLVAAFLLYTQQFFRPIQLATQVAAQAQSALAGAERIYAILDAAPETPDAPNATALHEVQGRIAFEDVSFGYEAGRPVLSNVTFTLEPGQTVALVGPTGAGKTTIAGLIPRFYDVSMGRVTLDGEDLRTLARADLRRQIAVVPQEAFLFSGTVAENLAFGRPEADLAEIERVSREVGAHDFIMGLSEGYQTRLGHAGTQLSQGQRQLLSIARAVLSERPILLLDEATSHVDTKTEATIQAALDRLLAGRTSLVIAHRLSTIRHADQILVIAGGTIAERGTHAELMALGGRYAELYRTQFGDRPSEAADVSSSAMA
ncbi:ABC transporter ATP-binding protein [bacterium]|nr:ABC transporter ATP-binding protein [bacterium]